MEICASKSPLSQTHLSFHSDSDYCIVNKNTCPEDHFVQNISIDSLRCKTSSFEIKTLVHSPREEFLFVVRSSSEEFEPYRSMYGAFNSVGDTSNLYGSVKYYSPTDFTKSFRPNNDFASTQQMMNCNNIEQQEKVRKHHKEKSVEQKSRKKAHKEKKKDKKEGKEDFPNGVFGMINQEDNVRPIERRKKHKKKDVSELNYHDLQELINNCNEDTSFPHNFKRQKYREGKQRSHSIDQIPTKDVTSEQKISRKPGRPRSSGRKYSPGIDKKGEFFMNYYYPPSTPSNPFQIYEPEQTFITQNQQIANKTERKKNKEKSKSKNKTYEDVEMPEYITLDQINQQTMNIKDEKFEHFEPYRWETEKKLRHHQQREFYGEYDQRDYQHMLGPYNDQNFNCYTALPNEYNEIRDQNKKSKRNEKENEKYKSYNKKTDKEYKALKKYIKKLAKEQQKEIYYLTKKDKPESFQDERVQRDRKFLEENLLKFDLDYDENFVSKNADFSNRRKAGREFIPLDLDLDESQMPQKTHRKKHNHKKKKNKKETTSDSLQRIRSTSLSLKRNNQNLKDFLDKNGEFKLGETEPSSVTKYKSETNLNSPNDDKNVICIYRNKDEKEDTKTVKLTKKNECLSIEKTKKYNKKNAVKEHEKKKEKESSPYEMNQNILQAENDEQSFAMLKMQQRSLNFQKAMTKDPYRPKPRLSRSRQRSSKYLVNLEDDQDNNNNLEVDDQPTKEVHCYDVGTSTILDNNFGDVLELLKREPLTKPLCSNKKRSVFHVKKDESREDLVESARRASDDGDKTLGIVVKGIEPPRKIETNKIRSKFKIPSEKSRSKKKLECKMLSVVAIPPSSINNCTDTERNTMKTQSTPQMMHYNKAEKRNSDKRLERLLKYYKVDTQSKINNEAKPSTKSIKAFIANKLSDYLKKLQEDENDDILQIQTDDPKLIKLILPVDLTALECSKSSAFDMKNNDQIVENPKESFSDIYINYTASTLEEDDYNLVELPKPEEGEFKHFISNESFDTRSSEPSIEFFRPTTLNFRYPENSGCPVSSRITENPNRMTSDRKTTRKIASAENHQFGESFPNKHLEQPKGMIMKDQLYHQNGDSPLAANTERENWHKMSKTEKSETENLNMPRNYTKHNENETNNKNATKQLHSVIEKRNIKEEASIENFQSKKNTINNIQVQQKQDKKCCNIDGSKAEEKKSSKVYNSMESDNYGGAISNKSTFKPIQSSLQSENNKIYNLGNNNQMSVQSNKQVNHNQRYQYSEQKENGGRYSRNNDNKKSFDSRQHLDNIYSEKSESQERTEKARYSQQPVQSVEKPPPTKRYEYFEIPLPKPSKNTRYNIKKDSEQNSNMKSEYQPINANLHESRYNKNSQIPKRIPTPTRNAQEDFPLKPKPNRNTEQQYKEEIYRATVETSWNNHTEKNEMDNSLEKCLNWNIRNSETVVMSELNDLTQNMRCETEQSTNVPIKSNIPVPKKDNSKIKANQEKSACAGENNTTMFLTKSFKVPPGQSSYERRKLYDTRIRKNVKKRSLSESSGQTKKLPLIYEVRYCNVFNQCSPHVFDLGGSRSDQNLSSFSTDLDMGDFQKSVETLTTAPSCYLKEEMYDKEEEDLSTLPSCFLKGSKYEEGLSTDPSCLLKEGKYGKGTENQLISLSTEPSCLLKESKYDINLRKKEENIHPKKNNRNEEESSRQQSLRNGRIKELMKENLLYSNHSTQNRKPKFEVKKRRKKTDKRNNSAKIKLSKGNSEQCENTIKISAEPKEYREDEAENDSQQCQNLTKLSIDKVTGNKLRVSFENRKLPKVDDETVLFEKPTVNFSADSDLSNERESSVSSKSTLVNVCPSITSEESKETVKEREAFVISADDSGYLTKSVEKNRSTATLVITNNGEGTTHEQIEENLAITRKEKKFKWNQKDLFKLRVQLLFPHVYDDFELLETARNTDLIKYYVESENGKLKEAIDSISQKENMSAKSRSVMSLPSVKMIPEEPGVSGDTASEYSFKKQPGGFFNYQKYIAQSNKCYSTNLLKKLSKSEVCGDCGETLVEDDISETCSVKSGNTSSVKSSVAVKKSVIELFKLRPSNAKKSSSSMLSDNETLVGENDQECLSMKNNISDEEFFNNFHQIMAIECQRYAKKVRDTSKTTENAEDNLEYEEIPLECLLKNKNSNVNSSEDHLDQEFQLASDEVYTETKASTESVKKESSESFKSLTYIKSKKSNSKWQTLLKKKSTPGSNSKFNLDFYPQEKMSILDMIKSVQASSISEDSLICSPRDNILSVISSGEVGKHSEKQFFDNLLAFYDKESETVKKLIRDDEFFSSLIENIRNSEDVHLMGHKDSQKKTKKEKKRGILSRFFRWKEKKSTETLFENPPIGKSLEFARSMSIESSSITRESSYSFYKDLEDLEKDINDANYPNSEHLQQLAHKAKCHLEPMVKASISNRHISDRIKLAGFLKILDMVAKGDFTFLNNSDNRTLEEKLRERVAHMFEKVYRIANLEVLQKDAILDHDKIQLLKILVTKYHMGVESHINILAIYIGRGLIESRIQLEDAIIYLMSQDSQEINYEQLEKNCNIKSG